MTTRNALPAMPMTHSQSEQVRSRLREHDSKVMLGHHTVIPEGEFSLEDSAEEISLHMAHKIEGKLHSERKVRGERAGSDISIEAIQLYLEKAQDEDAQASLEAFAERILSGRDDPRNAADSFSNSAARQYLALNYALHKGKQQQASEYLLAEIVDARAELEELEGPAIRAELNTIEAAAAYARDATDINDFQRVYEDVVLGESQLSRTLSTALERFGGKRIGEGLQALIQALGMDVAATRPSVSTVRLQALITDMYLLEVAVTVLDGCRELGERLTTAVQASFNEERLMQSVVNVIDNKWISASGFSGMAMEQGIELIPDRIAFMSGVRSVLKDLPVQIFSDDETRFNVIEAAQFALDAAIDEELS